jgi:hypothetical protein
VVAVGWVKLDDGFFRHRKVVELSGDAKLLFLAGLTYAAEQLTDGYLSRRAVRLVAGMYADVPEEAAKELLEVGLWRPEGEGFQIHDYLEFNPTAETERARRQATKERVRRFRAKGNGSGNGVTRGATRAARNGARTATPSPSPSPSPSPARVSSPSDNNHPPPQVGEEEDLVLRSAARLIAERRLERRSPELKPLTDPDTWLKRVTTERANQHRSTALAILEREPATTAEQLADELEPAFRPKGPAWVPCGQCDNGLVEVEQDGETRYLPCPCRSAR